MPRPSKNRHVLARLRRELGLTQRQLAGWVGCSRIAIQHVERGERGLSESMARNVAQATGVALDWLLKLNYRTPPLTAGGQRLTREGCDRHRAWSKIRPATPAEMQRFHALTKGLTVGLAGPALQKRIPRQDLKGVPYALDLTDRAGRPVPMPAGVVAQAVGKTLQEQSDRLAQRRMMTERAYALLERCWRVLVAGLESEDRVLILHRLEEAVDKVAQEQQLTVSKELSVEQLKHLAEHFALCFKPPFTTKKRVKPRPPT